MVIMKKRLKPWLNNLLTFLIIFIIGLIFLLIMANRVQYFNNNIEKCGSNYCDK
jgi:hypothetical protein